MEDEISLGEIFAIIKKKLVLIISLALVGLSLSAAYTFYLVTPSYNATTQLLVNHKAESGNEIQLEDINTNVQMINTYKDIIKGPVILELVQKKLEPGYSVGQLAGMVSIGSNTDSQVFSLTITTTSPTEAAVIANEIATTFQSNIGEIMNVENVTIISKATVNPNPISPNIPMNLVLGLLVGAMLGAGIAFLLHFMDNTVKDSQFIRQIIGWEDIGVISEMKKDEQMPSTPYRVRQTPDASSREGGGGCKKADQLRQQKLQGTVAIPNAALVEQFRILRTNLHFAMMGTQLKSIVLTSATNSAGKSTIAVNLAVTIAQQGTRVLLVDCDFRRPTVHDHFKLSNDRGMTALLTNPSAVFQDYVQTTPLASLSVLTGGPMHPNPVELLFSIKMMQLEKELEEHYDLIIYDTPPILGFADTLLLAGRDVGTLYVVQYGVACKDETLKAAESLKRVNAYVLGTVYNRVPVDTKETTRYHYYQQKGNSQYSDNAVKL
jgi:capsular exopolysaccharide synthesis family protein